MGSSDVELLLAVNFLYFASVGLVTPALTPHIMANGGNHVVVGFLVAGNFWCGKYSKKFVEKFEYGKKLPIAFSLHGSFMSYLLLVIFENWVAICLSKFVWTFTNHVTYYSKIYASGREDESSKVIFFNFVDIIRVSAMALGLIVGGNIFVWTEQFTYLAMISTILSLTAIILLQYVSEDLEHPPRVSSKHRIIDLNYRQQREIFKVANFRTKWDKVLLKLTFTFTYGVYFARFPFLLTSSYEVGIVIVSFVAAYQVLVTFASEVVAPFIKNYVTNQQMLFELSLIVAGFSLASLCYLPSYECYLIMFVPLTFSHILVSELSADDSVFDLTSEDHLREATEVADEIVNIVGALLFGVMLQVFGRNAFKVVTLLPVAVCVYLVVNQRHSKKIQEEGKRKED